VREYDLPVEERVAAARRLAAQGMSQAEIARYLGVSPRTVRSYMRAGDCPCGTPLASPSATHCRPCAARVRAASRWTAPEILEAMRRWERETGLQPTVRSWGSRHSPVSKWHEEYPAWPSSGLVIAQFGSWRAALRRVGFATFKRTWTRDEVIAVLQLAARVEGRSPRQTDWMRATAERPAASTVRNLFGTWQAALHAAGIGLEA
jgi:hypothetical protein